MCDTLVATPPRTASGRVLFAKNSDRKPGECQPWVQFPAAAHARGSHVRCTHIEIPQVAETYRAMGHRPWWVWGFEHGVNEHAVAIGNLTIFSREPLEEEPGLIGMDLVRLGLERGRTAREALEIIAGLLEVHGQGGPAFEPAGAGYHNAFHLADPDEAWILETSNRHWAARRAPADTCSNHMALGSDWEIASLDLESFARGEGWWSGNGRIDVAAAYRNPFVPAHISEGRWRRSRALLADTGPPLDVARLQACLRDHGEGHATWTGGTTPEDEAHFTLCAHSRPVSETTASLVSELPLRRDEPWPVWVSFGTPCTGVFLPVYLEGLVPPELARGGEKPEPDSAWWTFYALQETALADPVAGTLRVRDEWRAFEEWLERERTRAEAEARAARELDRRAELLTQFMARVTDEALTRARALREVLAHD